MYPYRGGGGGGVFVFDKICFPFHLMKTEA